MNGPTSEGYHSGLNNNKTHLRPEARPINYGKLDEEQRAAFHRILFLLKDAIDLNHTGSSSPHMSSEHLRWLASDPSSRIAFLSGARGTGKTTLLLSLAKELEFAKKNSVNASHFLSDYEKMSPNNENGDDPPKHAGEVCELVKSIAHRLVWLEHLDMETFPNSANMLAAILARIDDGMQRSGPTADHRMDLLEPSLPYHESLLTLQQLQTDVALAWDGNLPDRGAHLDPDVFALEAMRAERARLSVNSRLASVLDALANHMSTTQGTNNPIFLLSIDDFDINPGLCLPLLRLIRMVSVPRLFVLVLGDIDLATVVFNLKISGDLARVAGTVTPDPDGTNLLSLPADYLGNVAGEVAFNALRKLVPPAQRIELKPLVPREGLNFRPFGQTTDSCMHMLLAKIPFESERFKRPPTEGAGSEDSEPRMVEQTIRNLRQFILLRSFRVIGNQTSENEIKNNIIRDEEIENSPYSGLEFFRAPIRTLSDLWFGLQHVIEMSENKNNKNKDLAQQKEPLSRDVLLFFSNVCRRALEEDRSLAALDRRKLGLGLRTSEDREPELDILEIGLDATVASPQFVTCVRKMVREIEPSAKATRPSGDEIYQFVSKQKDTDNKRGFFQVISEDRPALRRPEEHKNFEVIGRLRFCSRREPGWRLFRKSKESHRSKDSYESNDSKDSKNRPWLSNESRSSLILYHDLEALNETRAQGYISAFSPSHYANSAPWASVEWCPRATLINKEWPRAYWPLPAWRSFWEYDLFLGVWTEMVDYIGSKVGVLGLREEKPKLVDALGFAWISAATAIVSGDTPVQMTEAEMPKSKKGGAKTGQGKNIVESGGSEAERVGPNWWNGICPLRYEWKDVFGKIRNLANENTRESSRGQLIRDWAARVSLITVPEAGLSMGARQDIWACVDKTVKDKDEVDSLFDIWDRQKEDLRELRPILKETNLTEQTRRWLEVTTYQFSDGKGRTIENEYAREIFG